MSAGVRAACPAPSSTPRSTSVRVRSRPRCIATAALTQITSCASAHTALMMLAPPSPQLFTDTSLCRPSVMSRAGLCIMRMLQSPVTAPVLRSAHPPTSGRCAGAASGPVARRVGCSGLRPTHTLRSLSTRWSAGDGWGLGVGHALQGGAGQRTLGATRALGVREAAAATSSSDTDDEAVDLAAKTSWNLKGLRGEVAKQVMRQFKKVTKADERLRRVRQSRRRVLVPGTCGYPLGVLPGLLVFPKHSAIIS